MSIPRPFTSLSSQGLLWAGVGLPSVTSMHSSSPMYPTRRETTPCPCSTALVTNSLRTRTMFSANGPWIAHRRRWASVMRRMPATRALAGSKATV